MKCIYLFILAVLGFVTAATAQRHIDVVIRHYYEIASIGQQAPSSGVAEIVDGTHILFGTGKSYEVFLSFDILNWGSSAGDTVAVTDTIHIAGNVTNITKTGIAIGQNNSSGKIWSQSMPEALTSIPTVGYLDWCDSVWVTSPLGSSNPVNEAGRTANNITCHQIFVDRWPTSLENVFIGGNGLEVFPNPSNGNMSVVYNFGNNNSGVITIVDMTGKVVYTQQLEANLHGAQIIKIQTQGLANGVYSLRLATGNKVAVEKIYINN